MDPLMCKGPPCDSAMACSLFGQCQYKSSAELMREQATPPTLERDPSRTPVVVTDFGGKIDGSGIKTVMKEMKVPLELMPPQFTEGVAEVLKFGAKKYAANNWMKGMSWETVAGGILRHVTAFRRGEEMDPESGLPHLDHAACGIMFLRTYAHGPEAREHRKFDDRLHKELPEIV